MGKALLDKLLYIDRSFLHELKSCLVYQNERNFNIPCFFFVFFFNLQGGTIQYLVKFMRVTLADRSKDMIMYQELTQHVS